MSSRPALWLLRHAQPLIAPGVCYGRLNVPADPLLTLQAAGHCLLQLPAHAVLRHSPLLRCAQLVEALQWPERQVQADERLQEMDFGLWEGMAWSDIARPEIDAWAQSLYAYAPGGGEALSGMLERVRTALVESWRNDSSVGAKPVVWVTHAGVIRCVQWLLQYGRAHPQSKDWNMTAPGMGGWLALPWHQHAQVLEALC